MNWQWGDLGEPGSETPVPELGPCHLGHPGPVAQPKVPHRVVDGGGDGMVEREVQCACSKSSDGEERNKD